MSDVWKWLVSPEEISQFYAMFPVGTPIAIAEVCSRFLWTGNNQARTFVDGVEFINGTKNEIMGIGVLRWLNQNAHLNSGLGPTIACGALAHLYVAACAAHGIYARQVAACNSDFPDPKSDVTAEYWDTKTRRWVHIIPWCNCRFRTSMRYLSYWDWSSDIRKWGKIKARLYSTTSGLPLSRQMDYYMTYLPTLYAVGCISNGNGAYVDRSAPWHTWKVWDDLGDLNPYKDTMRDCKIEDLYLPPEPLR